LAEKQTFVLNAALVKMGSKMPERLINQDETPATYLFSLSNAEFATAVYHNVLGRIPEQEGFEFWVDVLDTGARGRDQFILAVLGSGTH
jgi:hypothetical protein